MTNYMQYSWRQNSRSAAKRPNQSVLFSALTKFAIVALVLQMVVPGLALAVVPPTPNWGITWTSPAQCSADGDDESPDQVDLYGTDASPAIGFASDENFRYFREVVLADPSGPGGYAQNAWVVLLQVTSPKYQYLAAINGKVSGGDKVQLYANSTVGADVDFGPPPFSDAAEAPAIWEGPVSTYANTINNGDFYIVEWAIPLSVFEGSGITDNTTKFFATSTDANNFNKDHLNCYETGTDLAVTKTDSLDPIEAGSNLTYTVTVTNNGPEDATGVSVTDVLPAGVTYVSHTASTGTFNDTSGVWTVGGLSNGASATLTITVAVGSEVANTTISNTATVSSTTVDINTTNNLATEDTTVNEPAPEEGTLSIVKVIINDNGGTVTDPSQFSFQVNDDTAVSFEGDGQNDLIVPVGTYTVTEPSVTVYATTYQINGEAADSCADLGVTNGGTTTCTITNDDIAPSLTLVKDVNNDNVDDESLMSSADAWMLYANTGPTPISGAGGVTSDQTFWAGTYDLLESEGPVGYTASAWSCVKNGGEAVEGASIALAVGDIATCTITNTAQAGSITLTKEVTNDNGGGLGADQFGLFVDDLSVTSGVETIVNAGLHYIGELLTPGYAFMGVSGEGCPEGLEEGDGNLFGSVTVGLGQNISCTLTNDDQAATLIVYKEVVNEEGGVLQAVPGDFEITVTGTDVFSSPFPGVPYLDGGTTVTLDAGSYSVTETGPEGYSATSMSDACSSVTSSNIAIGETRECYIYNTSYEVTKGRIIVDKVTDPSGDSQLFSFNLTGPGFDQTFGLSDTSQTYDSGFIDPVTDTVTYSLSEDTVPGWQLDEISCVSGEVPNQLTYTPSSISLAAGDVVFCTAYNTKLAQIVVEKITNTGETQDSTAFDFTASFVDGSFSVAEGAPFTSEYLEPGSGYSVTEGELPEGWSQVSATCDNEDEPSNITLNPGDVVTCTFTNNLDAQIEVVKTSVGDTGNFHFTGLGGTSGFDLDTTEQPDNTVSSFFDVFADIDGSTYNITEQVPEGWVLAAPECVYDEESIGVTQTNGVDVTVYPGDYVTCTFTNTVLGSITIEKETNPSETQQSFQFETNIPESNFELASGDSKTFNSLQPGDYTFTELDNVEGWSLTGLTCNGPEEGYSVEGNSVTVDLAASSNITCTFTNTEDTIELGSIHGYKWNDADGDSERGEEELLAGWTIFIDENENGVLDDGELSTLTSDATEHFGWYWFNNLPYGTYSVCEVNQDNWTKTYPEACHTVTLPDGNPQSFPVTPNAVIGPEYNFGNDYNETSDLSITKEVSNITPDINQTITYTITVSNDGPDDATSVEVLDDLPSGVTHVLHSASQGTYDSDTGVWAVGTLGDDESATLTIEVTVNSGTGGQTITNRAGADSDESDPNSENSSDSAALTVNQPTVVITGGGGGGGGGVPSLYIHTEQVASSTDTSAVITWFTNLPATSRVVYDIVSHAIAGALPNFDYAQTTAEDPTFSTFHSMAVSGLTPGTPYYFRPVSSDVSNTVIGVQLAISTTGGGEVEGAQTQGSTLPAGGNESTTPSGGSGSAGEGAGAGGTPASGEVAGAEIQELAQALDELPAPPIDETTPPVEPETCSGWGWLLVVLDVLAAVWLWNKYKNSARWNKYLWIFDLVLTAVLTWLWLGSCNAWVWMVLLLIVAILYALFTSEGESTPAAA